MLVKGGMSKLLALVILGLMAAQLIKPLGLPGLRRRRDFWKLAVVALAAISATVLISHGR
jgi:ABC-type branched-subunit amino acid transport system permease subunit